MRTLFFHSIPPPHVLDSVFFLSLNVWTTLGQTSFFCWNKGSGYSLRVSKGSLYRVSPDKITPKCWGWSNLWLTWTLPLIKKACTSCIRGGGALFKNIYKYQKKILLMIFQTLTGHYYQMISPQLLFFFYWSKSSLVYVIYCPIFPPFSLHVNVQSYFISASFPYYDYKTVIFR